MQGIKVREKTYFKIHELTQELDNKLKNGCMIPVSECRDLLSGINLLAIQLENEFIYRGDLLRQMADILEKYGWKRILVPEPSEN